MDSGHVPEILTSPSNMAECTSFPSRQNTDMVFYVTNVILIPVLFGVGFMGNIVTTFVCNHSRLRRENAVYIHMCGLAVCDAIVLLCTVPTTLQEVEIFPADVTYSRLMAYAHMASYVFGNVARHSGLWLMVTMGFHQLYISRHPYEISRMTRNSTNRIVVFVVVLFCILFNFPRFFEVSVQEVQGHCFYAMSLWDFTITHFGNQAVFKVVYPWAIIGVGYALPLLLMFVAAMLLGQHAGWKKLNQTKTTLRASGGGLDQSRFGLLKSVWIVLIVGFTLEIPQLAIRIVTHAFHLKVEDDYILYTANIVAKYLSLLHSSVNFIIYIVHCADFRRALRRSCCCLCDCSDEFYEPCVCCNPSYRKELENAKAQELLLAKKLADKATKSKKHKSKDKVKDWSTVDAKHVHGSRSSPDFKPSSRSRYDGYPDYRPASRSATPDGVPFYARAGYPYIGHVPRSTSNGYLFPYPPVANNHVTNGIDQSGITNGTFPRAYTRGPQVTNGSARGTHNSAAALATVDEDTNLGDLPPIGDNPWV